MATYYIVENNKQAGPFTYDQLAAKGITPETNVWTEGMANWTPASQVSELQALFAPQMPPQPEPQYAPQPEPQYAPQPEPQYAPQPQYTPQPEPDQQTVLQDEPQADYSSSSSQNDYEVPATMPKDYKMQAIILIAASVFCCGVCAGIINLVLGIMALLESNKIEGFYQGGNYAAAQEASDKAGKYFKIGIIILGVGLVLEVIFTIIYVIIGIAANS